MSDLRTRRYRTSGYSFLELSEAWRGAGFSSDNAQRPRLRQHPHRNQSGCNLTFSLLIERESIRARDDQGFAG